MLVFITQTTRLLTLHWAFMNKCVKKMLWK